jgi:hypothetical protein
MHGSQQAMRRLPDVLRRLAAHPGPAQPAPQAASQARRLLQTHGAISCTTIPSRIWYVTDGGHRHMVATFEYYGEVADFTCSCGSETVCAHLLAVFAMHDKDLAAPAAHPGRHARETAIRPAR